MLYETFHRLVLPIVVISVIGCVWVAGWSKGLVDEANRGSWPALPVPHLKTAPNEGIYWAPKHGPSSQTNSLNQVLLKHDQVVGVR
jgi:hypothetical protein